MEWLEATLRALEALPEQHAPWSTGAAPTEAVAVARLVEVLLAVLDPYTPPPALAPTWAGGVQVEWHQGGIDLEIEAYPDGRIEYFFRNPHEEQEGVVALDEDYRALTACVQALAQTTKQ